MDAFQKRSANVTEEIELKNFVGNFFSEMAHHFLSNKWMNKRLRNKNAIFTPGSETTVMINYSDSLQILEVEFTGGRVYHYLNVDLSKWEEYKSIVESGGSSGVFINTKIKPFYEAVEIT